MSNNYNDYSDSKAWDYLTIIGYLALNILAFLNTFTAIIAMIFNALLLYVFVGRIIMDKLEGRNNDDHIDYD